MPDNAIMDGKFNVLVPLNMISNIYKNDYLDDTHCVLLYGREYQ